MTEYDSFADIYDIDMGLKTSDLRFVRDIVEENSSSLVLASGTGREVLELAEYSSHVVGVDVSEEMNNIARRKILERNITNIDIIKSPMELYRNDNAFDNIIAINNSLIHLLSSEALCECLVNCYINLMAKGRLVIDYFRPDIKVMAETNSGYFLDKIIQLNDNNTMIRYRQHKRDPFTLINENTIIYEFIDSKGHVLEKRICQYSIRYILYQEIIPMLKMVGFIIKDVYGDYDKSNYCSSSPYLIIIAEKP